MFPSFSQAYFNIVTGACFALGLKYAGSANEEAFKTLLGFCHLFTNVILKSIAEISGRPTVETCLNMLLLSASMVSHGVKTSQCDSEKLSGYGWHRQLGYNPFGTFVA